jgi:hypothetical protein
MLEWCEGCGFQLMEEIRNEHKIVVGNPERNRKLERRRCKWEVNIRTDFNEVEYADGLG